MLLPVPIVPVRSRGSPTLLRWSSALAQVHMSKWLPSFVARDATTSLPFIGICRRAFCPWARV